MFHQNYFRLIIIDNKEKLNYLVKEFEKSTKVFWDTETSGLYLRAKGKDYLVGYSFMFDTNNTEAFYIPVRHCFEGTFESNVTESLAKERTVKGVKKVTYSEIISKRFDSKYFIDKKRFPHFYPERFEGEYKNIDCNLDILKRLFENGHRELIAHNITFDLHTLATEGFNVEKIFENNTIFDTQLAIHSINEETEKKLEKFTEKTFGIKKSDYDAVVKTVTIGEKVSVGLSTRAKANFPLVQIPLAGQYSTEDVYFMKQLYPKLVNDLKKEDECNYYGKYRIPLLTSLYLLERQGVTIDETVRKEMEEKAEKILEELIYRAYEIVGESFKITSGQQCAEVLFGFKKKLKNAEGNYYESYNEELVKCSFGYTPITFTEGGENEDENLKLPQTNIEVLTALLAQTPKRKDGKELVQILLDYSKLNKIYTAFLKGLEGEMYADNKVHPSFNQTGTQTYRLSCSSPNLQQLPRPLEIPKEESDYYNFWSQFEIRRLIIPDDDSQVIVAADYSNLEKRITAHFSQDKALQRMFSENLDSHGLVATMLFDELKDVHPNEVKKIANNLRNIAKQVSFAMDYLGTSYAISNSLGISRDKAQVLIDKYFKGFSGLHKYSQDLIKQARKDGYVTTILGHKRHTYGINSSDYKQRTYYERAAVNAVCQGSGADIITLAQLDISNDESLMNRGVKMLIQVHDELVFQVPKVHLNIAMQKIKLNMEKCLEKRGIVMTPNLIVNIDKGNNYAEAK